MKTCMLLFHDLTNPRIDPRVYKEAISLIDYGMDVTVINWAADFSFEGEPIESLEKNDNFEGIYIKRIFHRISSNNIFVRIIQQFSVMFKLANETISENPDVIHCHDLHTLLSGIIVKRRLNIPLIYDSHEYWPGVFKERSGMFLAKMCEIYERILLSQVDLTITVSEELAKSFERFGMKTHIIYNSRKIKELQDVDEIKIKELRHSLNISNTDFVVGYIGAINSKRGLNKLIESIEYLNEVNIKLLIVGGGQKKLIDDLKRKINDDSSNRVIFTGEIPFHDVLPYFSLLDIGCVLFQPFPNHLIAAPNKLFEYMGMSVPLLVSDFPEMHRIAIDSNCGICVDPTDPKEIAEAILWLYGHQIKLKKIGENGRISVEEKYSWERMEERLFDIYKDILP